MCRKCILAQGFGYTVNCSEFLLEIIHETSDNLLKNVRMQQDADNEVKSVVRKILDLTVFTADMSLNLYSCSVRSAHYLLIFPILPHTATDLAASFFGFL